MKNKILAVLMMGMVLAAPQVSADSSFKRSTKTAGDVAAIGLGSAIAIPLVVAGAVVLLPVMLLASMSGGMNY